jgi:hypothetical protein
VLICFHGSGVYAFNLTDLLHLLEVITLQALVSLLQLGSLHLKISDVALNPIVILIGDCRLFRRACSRDFLLGDLVRDRRRRDRGRRNNVKRAFLVGVICRREIWARLFLAQASEIVTN